MFAALQTPGDSQLRLFGGAFPRVELFVDALIAAAKRLPSGWHLRVKEHPTANRSFTHLLANSGDLPIYFDNASDTFAQVKAARAVLTVNSSVGLEAMFLDKPVVACGQCFWAIDGVADRAETPAALADIAANPDSLSFDPSARDAFLGYLTSQYYPRLKGDYAFIAARLNGPDDLGFWRCST